MKKILMTSLKVIAGSVILFGIFYAMGIGQDAQREMREEEASLPANVIINEEIIKGHAWLVSQGDGVYESFVRFEYNNVDYQFLVPTLKVVECMEILDPSEITSKGKTMVNYKVRTEIPRYTSQCDNELYWTPDTEINLSDHCCDQRKATIFKKKDL